MGYLNRGGTLLVEIDLGFFGGLMVFTKISQKCRMSTEPPQLFRVSYQNIHRNHLNSVLDGSRTHEGHLTFE